MFPGAWECPSIFGGKRSLLDIQGCINHTCTASVDRQMCHIRKQHDEAGRYLGATGTDGWRKQMVQK